MKAVLLVLTSTLLFAGAFAHADEATEQEVIKTIMDGNAYAKKNLKDQEKEKQEEEDTSKMQECF